jgi:hypothetical protein
MTIEEFRETLSGESAPAGLSDVLLALWHDARGEWEEAHRLTQDVDTVDAARVHAYLHRKEGDDSNARYWYARAKRAIVGVTLDEEWTALVNEFLNPTITKPRSKK